MTDIGPQASPREQLAPGPATPFLVLVGVDPSVQELLARYLRAHLGWRVEVWSWRDLFRSQPHPDVLLGNYLAPEIYAELHRQLPSTRIIAHVPAQRSELWEIQGVDRVVDQLAPVDVLLECLTELAST